VFFVSDWVTSRRLACKDHEAKLELLSGLLRTENVAEFYRESGGSRSQEHLSAAALRLWRWEVDPLTQVRERALSWAERRSRMRGRLVLDAGCGRGGNIPSLVALGNTVVGADLDPVALARAKERGATEVFQASVDRLPFPDAHFDGVVFSEVLEHLSDPPAALRELRRVLKPGGTLILTTPNRNFVGVRHVLNPLKLASQLLGIWFPSLLPPRNVLNVWRRQCYFHTEFSHAEIRALLVLSGFSLSFCATYGIGTGILTGVFRLSPRLRKVIRELNRLELHAPRSPDFAEREAQLHRSEEVIGRWASRLDRLMFHIPLGRLLGSNHMVVASASSTTGCSGVSQSKEGIQPCAF
jgi:SAM-dependent methyltransferase